MKVIRANEGVERAFERVAQEIFALFQTKATTEPLVLGLCGGRSVVGLLKALRTVSAQLPAGLLKRVQFFMVDERLVPLNDEQSNYGGLDRLLFQELIASAAIEPAQLHPFKPDERQPDYGCSAYAAELRRYGGRFTCVVLGVGEDGHVAGLFPQHPLLQRAEPTFFSFFDSPKPPAQRMTCSRALIATADLAVVLALGDAKREAWERFQGEATTEADCPALFARQAQECVVVTDL
jgi:6-phosphogluconolactonase